MFLLIYTFFFLQVDTKITEVIGNQSIFYKRMAIAISLFLLFNFS